jgi:DNA adenine methylase
MRSPLCYLGGKSRLAPVIVPKIPPDNECYCEPFCGAAWILFAKEPSRCEVINDLDGELVTFWRVVQNHLIPFLDYFKFAVVSRRIFELENMKRPETLTDLQRAVRYYYIQRLAFGGKPKGRTYGTVMSGSPRLNLTDISETLLEVHQRLERVNVECLDALECIARYDRKGTFFFIDPPYIFNQDDYAVSFDRFQDLATLLGKLKGRFILTMTDCPEVRQIFGAFKISTVRLKYSISLPKTGDDSRAQDRKEVIVQNY